MNSKEIYEKIIYMEKLCAEDFYDLGGGCEEIFASLTNLDALKYLKENKPRIYEHICEAHKEAFEEDLKQLVEDEADYVNTCPYDYIFIFDKNIEDNSLFDELKEFSNEESFFCYSEELWKVVIAILAGNFPNMQKDLLTILDDENF